MRDQCPRCQNIGQMIDVHGHLQCGICGSVVDDCCQGEVAQKKKTYFIRVRAEYVGYFPVKADSFEEAEQAAVEKLFEEVKQIQIGASIDTEEYQPEEDTALLP